jgi:hypothetical protein
MMSLIVGVLMLSAVLGVMYKTLGASDTEK